MAEVPISGEDTLDGIGKSVNSEADLLRLYSQGLINRSTLIKYLTEVYFQSNAELEPLGIGSGWDPSYTETNAFSDAVARVSTLGLPDPDEMQRRAKALEAQELGATLSRAGMYPAGEIMSREVQRRFPGFGEATPVVRAGMQPYGQTEDALVRYFANLAPAPGSTLDFAATAPQTFQSFIAPGASPGQLGVPALREDLRNVQNILATPYELLGGPAAKAIQTSFQQPWTQHLAALQPGLAAVAPALRSAYRQGGTTFAEDWQARNPEKRFLDFAPTVGFF